MDTNKNISKAIKAGLSKDYIEFEKAIHAELNYKITQDPYMVKRKAEYDKYANITKMFQTLSTIQ